MSFIIVGILLGLSFLTHYPSIYLGVPLAITLYIINHGYNIYQKAFSKYNTYLLTKSYKQFVKAFDYQTQHRLLISRHMDHLFPHKNVYENIIMGLNRREECNFIYSPAELIEFFKSGIEPTDTLITNHLKAHHK